MTGHPGGLSFPADARAAFESGAVDAWAIWDAYLTSARNGSGARVLATGEGLVANRSFFFGTERIRREEPGSSACPDGRNGGGRSVGRGKSACGGGVARSGDPCRCRDADRDRRADAPGASALDEETIQKQQEAANAFQAAGLISHAPSVADATWNAPLHDGAKTASR